MSKDSNIIHSYDIINLGKSSATMMSLSFIGVPILLIILTSTIQKSKNIFSNAYILSTLRGEAQISHSGLTNALYGHEQLVDENIDKKRTKRGGYYGIYGNNKNNSWNNNLLYASEAPNNYLKMWIVSEHNKYRKIVPATDMRMIYWSDKLAASAQAHADTCDFRHSQNRVNIGENIWAAPYANYSDAIFRWFNEVNDPRCKCNHAYKKCCGHYVQVVWANTNLVGCGYAKCLDVFGILGMGHRAVFVCHYSPQGNRIYFNNGKVNAIPAFTWAFFEKDRCRDCPADAPACHEGLCYMPLSNNINETVSRDEVRKVNEKALNSNLIV